jgi:hypothetical protein
MKKNSLDKNGLSLSQAQSISNLCNQRAREISNKLDNINNVSKELVIGSETYIETPGNPIPDNVVILLKEKASLSATQAFLMENIKAKDGLINDIRFEMFYYGVEQPVKPEEITEPLPNEVDEEWGWDQLTQSEYNEYLEAEAYASHIGQFIHKRGTLDRLRDELPNIKTLEFMEIETGKKTPLKVTIHHSSEQLLAIHEELAGLHRGYEQRVNYFKAKVKNSVTSENARIQKQRADIQTRLNSENEKLRRQYTDSCNKYSEERTKAAQEFESKRQERIQEAANLKINVDKRFQGIIDIFLKQLS